jgi:hypothetical protein
MIIDFGESVIQPRRGVIVCEIHIIPSGFVPDHATFYNPAIPSGFFTYYFLTRTSRNQKGLNTKDTKVTKEDL